MLPVWVRGKNLMLKTQPHIILAKTALLGWVNWAAGSSVW